MKALVLSLLVFVLSACSVLPEPYRIDISQGNMMQQDMVDRLKPGMQRGQVQYLLGTPMLMDYFHRDRWDYLYSNQISHQERTESQFVVFFEGDALSAISGDLLTHEGDETEIVE